MRGSFLSSPIAVVGTIAAAAAITVGLLLFGGVGDDERSMDVRREPGTEHIDELAESSAENALRIEPRTCEQIGTGYQGFEIRVDWDEGIWSESDQQLLSRKYTEELERLCRRESNGR